MTPAWVLLPAAVFWSAVTPMHGKLVVSGPLQVGPRCGYLTVDPVSRRSSFVRRACVRDRVRIAYDRHSQWTRAYVGSRLAFRYQDSSTGRPVQATSGDALWLYDVDTGRGPVLQRWSLRTGRLVRELRFPVRLFRPVIAANDDGAWLMAAPNGGESDTPSEAKLFHATTRVTVVQRGARAALWMTGHGRTLWLETVTGYRTFKLWRYDGTRGRLLWTRQQSNLYGASYGGGALWGVSARYCGTRLRALRIDGRTGSTTTVADLPLLDCNQIGPGAYDRGWFWFVDGNKLFRVH